MYCYKALVEGIIPSSAVILDLLVDLGFGIKCKKRVVLYNLLVIENDHATVEDYIKCGDKIKIKVVKYFDDEVFFPHVLAYDINEVELNKMLIEKGVVEEYE